MRVLVTGASGFIGRALCQLFSRYGIDVVAVVREGSHHEDLSECSNIDIVHCDLCHYQNLSQQINSHIDVFFHLAWDGSSGSFLEDYCRQISNIESTCNAVEAASELNAKRFVFSGSIISYEVLCSAQYGDRMAGNSIYGSAKMCASSMARTLCSKQGIEYNESIISNVYGPGEISPRLINSTIRKLLEGIHCSFTAGEQQYDFIYIDDAARALASIGLKGCPNASYYLGSGKIMRLKEYLLVLRDIVNPTAELGLGEIPSKEHYLSYEELDLFSLSRDTGFSPRVSFEEGIRATMNWIIENG